MHNLLKRKAANNGNDDITFYMRFKRNKCNRISMVQSDDLKAIMHEPSDDGHPRHSKSPLVVSSVHSGKREWLSVCLPMKMRFSGMGILYH